MGRNMETHPLNQFMQIVYFDVLSAGHKTGGLEHTEFYGNPRKKVQQMSPIKLIWTCE